MIRVVVAVVCAAMLAGAAAAATGDPVKRHTAADMAKARSVVLRRADLPAGWTRDTSPDTDERIRCSYFHPDESDLVETGYAEGSFGRRADFAGSDATVYRTTADARASWARNTGAGLPRCFADFFRKGLAKEGLNARVVRAAKVAFPALAPRTGAWHVALVATSQGVAVPIAIDLVALGRGRIVSTLGLIRVGAANRPAELRRLAGLLATRMR